MTFKSAKLRKTVFTAALLAMVTGTEANDGHMGLDFSFSPESANIGLYTLRETSQELTNLGLDYFFNKDNDYFADVFGSIARKGFGGNENVELGLKGKFYYTNHDDYKQSGYGVMVGAIGRYWLPTEYPVTLASELLYGPSILAFENVDGVLQFDIRTEVQILPSAFAYLGYRKLDVTFDKGSKDLDSMIHFGVNVAFN